MNKTPDEKFDKDVWEVLQKIKLVQLQSKYNIPLIKWYIDRNNELENNIISQLEYEDIVKEIKNPIKWITDFEIRQIDTSNLVKPIHISDILYYLPPSAPFSDTLFLEILPKFNDFYNRLKTNIEDKKIPAKLVNNLVALLDGKYGKKLVRMLYKKDLTARELKDVGAKDVYHLVSNINKKITKQGFEIILTDKKVSNGFRKYHLKIS